MEGFYPPSVRLWDQPTTALQRTLFGLPGLEAAHSVPPRLAHEPLHQWADQLFASEALSLSPLHGANPPTPFSLQWFITLENQRHERHARWLPRLLEFSKHAGETLLGLGHGLGTDWLPYARHGASVIVCSASRPQLQVVQYHFQVRGVPGRFVHAQPTALPLDNASIDVVCLSGLLVPDEQPERIVDEVFRVLKPGGKVIVVAAAQYDVAFWAERLLFWRRWWHKATAPRTATPRFAGRTLHQLFGRFIEHRLRKRHLRRADVPHLWRLVPRPLLERLIGRVLVLKAFKPIQASIQAQLAA